MDTDELRSEERQKIHHAEKFFGDKIKIDFKTQFEKDKILDIIREIRENSNS